MESNKINIKAPFYRGLLLAFINSLFYITIGRVILAIISIAMGIYELLGMAIALYALMLVSFVAIKVYQRLAKSEIIINKQEITKCRGKKIIITIKVEDIKSIHFAKYTFAFGSFDEFNIYSKYNARIHFYAKETIISDIEAITKVSLKRE